MEEKVTEQEIEKAKSIGLSPIGRLLIGSSASIDHPALIFKTQKECDNFEILGIYIPYSKEKAKTSCYYDTVKWFKNE